MANSVWIVLRAVAVVVHEMSLRIFPPPLLHHIKIEIQAPVVFEIDAIAGAADERADVAAEVQNFAALPFRMAQHMIEVTELRVARRYEVPVERSRARK